jgi:hypothetical protein
LAVTKSKVSDRTSYITAGGHWCDTFPTEDKSDDTKDRFYEELEHALNQENFVLRFQ